MFANLLHSALLQLVHIVDMFALQERNITAILIFGQPRRFKPLYLLEYYPSPSETKKVSYFTKYKTRFLTISGQTDIPEIYFVDNIYLNKQVKVIILKYNDPTHGLVTASKQSKQSNEVVEIMYYW